MDDTFFDIPIEIKSNFDEKIASAFRPYDHQNNNMIIADDLGAILRTIGCVPIEKEIREIAMETEFTERKGTIHLSRLIAHLKPLLLRKHMKPYTGDDLLKVFKILDPKNRGYIPKGEFVQFMKEIGEPISERELSEMLKVCLDPISMRVDYEEYIRKIVFEPHDDDSIYVLAELSMKKRE